MAAAALAVLITQIALGGWVSSNYAALACVDFPTCHGEWIPQMDFEHGFQLVRELGRTAAGTHLAYQALTAIHWTHRIGAVLTVLFVGALSIGLLRVRDTARNTGDARGAIPSQVALGVANVLAPVCRSQSRWLITRWPRFCWSHS